MVKDASGKLYNLPDIINHCKPHAKSKSIKTDTMQHADNITGP